MVSVHGFDFTVRSEEQLLGDLHMLTKLLYGDVKDLRGLINQFKTATKKEGNQSEEEAILNRIYRLLFKLEQKEAQAGAWAEKVEQEEMKALRKDSIEHSMQLVQAYKLPKSKLEQIQRRARKHAKKIIDMLDVQADTSVEVSRHRKVLRFMRKMVSIQRSFLRQKKHAFNADKNFSEIKRVKTNLAKDENPPHINAIVRDIEELEDLHQQVVFSMSMLIFYIEYAMDKMWNVIQNLKAETPKQHKDKLLAIETKMEESWKVFMGKFRQSLQQLNQSVAPGEAKKAA